MKNVIVTGATSMIGRALIEECLANNVTVYAVIRQDTTRLERLPKHDKLKLVYCDLDHMEDLPSLILKPCDVFYHIAWAATGSARNKSVELQYKNIEYTMTAVRAAKMLGCRRFLGAGSQAEYGPIQPEKTGPNTQANPVTAYGVSKLAANQLSKILCEELEIEWIWPRIFSVYGRYEKESTMIQSAIRGFMNRESVAFTPAQQMWDYLYERDAGRAFYLMGEKGRAGSVYCIGSGQAKPLRDYILKIRELVDPDVEDGIGKKPYPQNVVMNLCADIESLTQDTGFKPEWSFEAGIQEILTYKARKENKNG